MGAIQQAFNQALSIGAIAAGPQIQKEREIRTARRAAHLASASRVELAEQNNPPVETAVLDEAFEREKKAHEAYYQVNPTTKQLEYPGVLRGEAEEYAAEEAAKKAATAMAQQQQQYKDQSIAALRETVKTAQSQHLGTREAK